MGPGPFSLVSLASDSMGLGLAFGVEDCSVPSTVRGYEGMFQHFTVISMSVNQSIYERLAYTSACIQALSISGF